ncbi:MAG: MarR family transcriptional regulator [Sphingomonas bacterium]|nr:MarR family transcriptional regulator [Sphingomonas bacterium]
MNMSRYDLEAAFAARLLPVARTWRRAADRALSGMGLSSATGWALVHVVREGGDLRQTDLAQMLEITDASLVRLLDQLGTAGLAERRTDEADARVRRIGLTAKGKAMVARIEAIFAGLRADVLAEVSDADLATGLAVIERTSAMLAGKSERP